MYTVSIDIGSSSSRAIVLQDGVKVAAAAVASIGTGTSNPRRLLAQIQEQSGLSPADTISILSTGYGRPLLVIADLQMSEISCHVRGVFFQNPTA